ncbi:olfactory receptor 6F1 [Xenopus laevis]|uniref:Olfactory receptor n=2 Tax=Xenopus laevis TaxID=8355 RepID=A0A974E2I8_XENLA|nr:olfactory receptor 6F1 [Xenopus laevis]OCU01742.1 hypothetical protein XELAEV_18007518mg [Xenopus laevis]
MEFVNKTIVTEFILLGFSGIENQKIHLFVTFLLIYILTVMGNIVIIAIVYSNSHLHTPMYFFLMNLSLLEILYTSNIIPRMLFNIITQNQAISFTWCIIQLYFFGSLGSTECILLGVMAYDRYIAICYPLHYFLLMNNKASLLLSFSSWTVGFIATFGAIILVSQLWFCGPNEIKHFYCDLRPVLQLSCKNPFIMETVSVILASIILLGTCLFTLVSYIHIILTILKIPSFEGRQRAFSTCGAHLTVVIIFYGAMIFMYVTPVSVNSFNLNKVLALLYTVMTPFINPFIYTLRNKEVRQALQKSTLRLKMYLICVK